MRAKDIALIVVGIIAAGIVGFMLWLKSKGVPCVLCKYKASLSATNIGPVATNPTTTTTNTSTSQSQTQTQSQPIHQQIISTVKTAVQKLVQTVSGSSSQNNTAAAQPNKKCSCGPWPTISNAVTMDDGGGPVTLNDPPQRIYTAWTLVVAYYVSRAYNRDITLQRNPNYRQILEKIALSYYNSQLGQEFAHDPRAAFKNHQLELCCGFPNLFSCEGAC